MPRVSQAKLKSDLQKKICKNILDTKDVVKSQVFSVVLESISDKDQLKTLKTQLDNVIDKQASSLVDRVIKETS